MIFLKVYIGAKIIDANKYLVEIGTGYFAKMSKKQATEYFQRFTTLF